MGIAEMLDKLKQKAHNDSALREELLAIQEEATFSSPRRSLTSSAPA